MYKFEIYQNINIPPTSIGNINKSRYSKDDYVFERVLNPKWDDIKFKWSKDSGRAFFRKTLDGEFSLVGDDYSWALGIRNGEYEINRYRYLKISEKVGGAWEERWTGFFSVADAVFDLNRCSAIFSDLLVFDEYTPIMENIESEVNLIDLPAMDGVDYEANEYGYDSYISTSTVTTTDWCDEAYWETGSSFADVKYTKYSKKYRMTSAKGIYREATDSCIYSATFSVITEWRRDYQYSSVNPGADWEDLGPDYIDENGLHRYVRHYMGDESPGYSTKKTRIEYQTYPSHIEFLDHCPYCNLWNIDITLRPSVATSGTNTRIRTLADATIYAIKDYIDFFDDDGNLLPAYQSQFFSNETNPVTGLENQYGNVLIAQLSDMKPTSDAATIGMYSIETLEKIWAMFQCKWYISDKGYFIVEHDKFFDSGLSYDGDESYDIDLSSQKITTELSYVSDLPYRETMEMTSSVNPDFVGLPIDCYGNIVNRGAGENIKQHSFPNIVTDLTNVILNYNSVGNDGFFIMTATIDNALGTAEVDSREGILTGVDIANGYMATSTLQDYFWKWGRSLSYGIMNREGQDFTRKNIVTHPNIITPHCGDFNPYKLVKTSYGLGKVEQAEYSLKDRLLYLTLSYAE